MTFDTFICVYNSDKDDDDEIDVVVEADVEPGYPDSWDEPGCDPSCEITRINRGDNGEDVSYDSLSPSNQRRLDKEAYEAAKDQMDYYD